MHTSIEKIKTTIFQDFLPHVRFIRNIGEGAFAQVYLIYDEKQQIHLAVKKINLFGLCDYQRKLVLNQAKILSSIHHSNIITFHSCLYDNNEECVYIFMQYAKEGDLLNLIYRTRLEKEQVKQSIIWKVITDISQALNYLHLNGIIHRDVKPANILRQGDNFKLADMNVSKIKEQGKMSSTNVGTPLYTSPQVASNQYYTEKCDIWSLGVVIYELCCFKNPFNTTSLRNLVKDKQKLVKSALDKIPLRYSKSLSDLIKRMLTKDPSQRISIKQILQICQKHGMSIKYISHQNIHQFKTLVFPPTSQRWINLVQDKKKKKQDLDLTIDQYLKESEFSSNKQNEPFSINFQDTHKKILNKKNDDILLVEDEYCLSRIQHKNHILKGLDKNLVKINNFMKLQDQSSQKNKLTIRKLRGRRLSTYSGSESVKQKSISTEKNKKFQRQAMRRKDQQNSKEKASLEYGLKFIKLSKHLQGFHS